MQPGQFLVNKNGEKRKILGVCGEAIIISRSDDFEFAMYPATKKELQNTGWSLLEEPWVPSIGEFYWAVLSDGGITKRTNYDNESDRFNLKIGNYGRTPTDAELYKQKLIERMGRKED